MLNSLRSGSDDRIRQSSMLLQQVKRLESLNDSSLEEAIKVQKGMFFVSLYASIEFTLTNAVSGFLAALQANPSHPESYHTALLTVILNREFNSVIDSKNSLWEAKASLIERIFSKDPATIDNSVFPANGINISADHFVSVWKHLKLPGQPLPDGFNSRVINEIKEHRNAIAHGRERASSIGGRFSLATLEDRHRAVEALCAHTVLSVEDHLVKKTYLQPL